MGGVRTPIGRPRHLPRDRRHLIGLELGVSIASAALHGRATGTSKEFNADVVAVAKKDLTPGDRLDGEGGYVVRGKLVPAARSISDDLLPMGLADGVRVTNNLRKGDAIRWGDVDIDVTTDVVELCRAARKAVCVASIETSRLRSGAGT